MIHGSEEVGQACSTCETFEQAEPSAAEKVERRGLAKGNTVEHSDRPVSGK